MNLVSSGRSRLKSVNDRASDATSGPTVNSRNPMIHGDTKMSPQIASRRETVSRVRREPVDRALPVSSTEVSDIVLVPVLPVTCTCSSCETAPSGGEPEGAVGNQDRSTLLGGVEDALEGGLQL